MIASLAPIGPPPAIQGLDIIPRDNTSFESLMGSEERIDQEQVIRNESRKLVAEAFIRPLLAQIREQNNAAAPFGATDAEKRFGPMIDEAVADSMTRPDRFPMVKAVEREMLARLDMMAKEDAS